MSFGQERWVCLDDVECARATDKALLIACAGLDEDVWIPTSQVHGDSHVCAEGDEGLLVITRWVAEEKGIEELCEDWP